MSTESDRYEYTVAEERSRFTALFEAGRMRRRAGSPP
jgi:hypothetical protein